jgi:hypothetical protein
MIKRQPARHPSAAVVPEKSEALVAQRGHDLDLILRHRALEVVDMILAAVRLAAVAVAAQVGGHHRVILRQLHRHVRPGKVRLRRAMQQQHRRSRATDERVDDGAAGVQVADFEVGKQPFVEVGLLRTQRRWCQYSRPGHKRTAAQEIPAPGYGAAE